MTWCMRLRARTGIEFDPHWFRHSAATRWLRDGVPDRGRLQAAGSLVGGHDVGHIRAPDGGGRAGGAGEGGLVHRAGGVLVTAAGSRQADRARWQRQAAAELAADPGRAPGICRLIAWTADPACGGPGVARSRPRQARRACSVPGGRRWRWSGTESRPRAGRLLLARPRPAAAA